MLTYAARTLTNAVVCCNFWVTGVLVRFVPPPQVREAVRKVLTKPLCSLLRC